MELVYLWVEKYKNIHSQGFNFSPRFECVYDEDNNELTIDENDDYIENFFGDNINVTAIVGKNGSGKSSVFEVLTYLYWQGVISNREDKTFFIYRENNQFYIQCENFKTIPIKKEDLESFISFQNNTQIRTPETFSARAKNHIKYFSNCLTDMTKETVLNSLKNYDSFYNGMQPANILIPKDKNKENFEQKFSDLLKDDNTFFNFLDEKFIFNNFRYEIHLSELEAYFSDEEECTELLSFRNKNIKEVNENEIFYRFLMTFLINETMRVIYHSDDAKFNLNRPKPMDDFYQENICNKITNFNDKSYDYSFYKEIKTICKTALKEINEDHKIKNILLNEKAIQDLLCDYTKLSKKKSKKNEWEIGVEDDRDSISYTTYVSNKISISESIKLSNFLKELYKKNILRINFYNHNNINNNFLSLSTGEQEYIKVLTNTAYTIKHLNDEKYIMMYDEIELSFHPAWQKKLMNNIIIIVKLLKSKAKIHFVLTSHSPFLLSDIPKQNIIFLDKDKNGNCKVLNHDKILQKKQTFGANIHTLLSDSFFMEDGLMGEFAKGKINDVYNFIVNHKTDRIKTKQEAQDIIGIIGEPLLKKELQQLFDEKFELSNMSLDDEINLLERKLKALKEIKE